MKKILSPLLAICMVGTVARAQFVENKGQVLDLAQNPHPEVRFYYNALDASLYFQEDRVLYAFREHDAFDAAAYANNTRALDSAKATLGVKIHRMDMTFLGTNPNPEMLKGEKAPGDLHFYLNERNGIRDVGSYQTVTYKNLYNHVDVVFYELPTGLKYDIVLHEGARIEDVKIRYEGVKNIRLEGEKVLIETSYKTLEEKIPLAYINADKSRPVHVNYALDEQGILSFTQPGEPYQTLTIDPVLEWATYLNQPNATFNSALDYFDNRLDADGNTYLYGHCYNGANGYPLVSPGGTAYQAAWVTYSDLYLAKFNANRVLVWGTYLGGSGLDGSHSSQPLVIQGNTLHVLGNELSSGAPFTNGGGYYRSYSSRPFWARFDKNTCQLQHLTSLPGGSSSRPSMAISNSGNVAIISHSYAGSTYNIDIVNRPGAYNQAVNGGYLDMYLMLFNPAYTQTWGTFLGGPSSQENFMCAFDNSENLYFMGETGWFTSGANAGTPANERLVQLPGAYYQSVPGGGTDVMLGKFNSSGALVWHTLYGGNNSDARQGQQGGYGKILIHPSTQEPFIAFNTTSSNFTTVTLAGAYNKTVPTHPDFGGSSGSFWNYAAFVAKFSTAGALNYASYWYNGDGGDLIMDITWGGCDKLYIGGASGGTNSGAALSAGFNMPTITSPNGANCFVTQVSSTSFAQEWASFLANNTAGRPSITGHTSSPRVYVAASGYYNSIPTVNPGNGAYYNSDSHNPAGPNFGIWQLHPSLPPDVTGDLDLCSGETTLLTASGGTGTPYNWYSSNSSTPAFHTNNTYTTPALSDTVTYYVSSGTGMCESPRTPVTVNVASGGGTPFTVTGGGSICAGGSGLAIGLNGSQAGISYQLYHDGIAEGTPVGGSGNAISFGSFTAAGTYTVVAGGSGGSCSTNMTGSAVIAVVTTPAAPAISSNSPLCVGSTLQLNGPTLAATDYFWNGPNGFTSSAEDPQIASVTAAASGTYSLYVVSGSCTSATATQTITVNAIPTAPSFTTNSPVCTGNAINLTGPAVSGATYVWSGPNAFTSAVQSPSITGTTAANAGTYTLYVVVGGCTSSTATQNVVINNTPAITLGTIVAPGCGLTNGSATINGTGSGAIGWTGTTLGGNPFASLPYTMTNLGAGTYNVGFVSSQGCTSNVVVVTLTNPGAPATPTFSSNTPVCEGSTLNLDGPAVTGATYVWSGPNAFTSSVENPSIASVPAAGSGTYNLYVVVNGCTSATATQAVTVNPLPAVPNFTTNSPLCEGSTLNLTGPAVTGATYVWSGPNTFTSAVQNPSITGTTAAHAGTYSLNVVVNGCTSGVATQNIVINPIPVIALGTVTTPTGCGSADGSVQITGTGNGSLGWTGTATGIALSVTLPHTITNLGSGSYSVAFVSAAGCTSNVVVANIGTPPAPGTPTFSSNSPICAGSNINFTATPVAGATYVWSGPNGFSAGTATPSVPSAPVSSSGTYSLYVVVNGCTSATATQNVTVNPTPATPIFSSNAPICTGNTLTLDAATVAGAGYGWSGPNGFTSTLEDPSITGATPAATGPYGLYVVVNGCTSATATQTLTVFDIPPAPTAGYNNPLCEGDVLQLNANSTGANAYGWSGPGGWTSTNANPDIANATTAQNGTYSVYAVIGTCTSATATVQVFVAPKPNISYSGPLQNCGPDIPFAVTETPTGNTIEWFVPNPVGSGNPFHYSHSGTLPATINGSATATNAAGCSETISFTVQLFDSPVPQFSVQDACDGESLNLVYTGGGNPNLLWSWPAGGATTPTANAHFGTPGTYFVTLIATSPQNAACTDTLTEYFTVLPQPQTSFTYQGQCLKEIQFTGTATPDSILQTQHWDFGDGTTATGQDTTHTYSADGTYTVTYTVETQTGCTFSTSQPVDVKLSAANIPDNIPNIFSPNGDPINQEVNFDNLLGDCGDYEAVFYNRWGSPVFTQKNGTAPFAGKSDLGTRLSPGVYFYVLRYGDSQKGGNITLVW